MELELNNQSIEKLDLLEAVEENRRSRDRIIYQTVKRSMDFILALAAIIPALPFIFLICILVAFETRAFPIYIQERLGMNGRRFNVYKIRTMYKDAEKNGPKWADKDDKRVTRLGRFLRRARIDELPQLANIIVGDMSIVGPRPERESFTYIFESQIPGFTKRLQVKPGLTGYAQINGGYDLTPREKFLLDSVYLSERSLLLDLKIMLKTVEIVFSGKGSR